MERKLSAIVNTLIGSGFQFVNVTSKPSYLLLRVYRTDEFGIRQRYVFAYSGDNTLKAPAIAGLRKVAANDTAPLVIIGTAEKSDPIIPILTLDQFVGQMGGSVPTFLPLEPREASFSGACKHGVETRPDMAVKGNAEVSNRELASRLHMDRFQSDE